MIYVTYSKTCITCHVRSRHPEVFWRQKAASHQGTQPQEALLARYRSSVSRYQNPQSRTRKAHPHAESVDHFVDRSAIPSFVVPICDRCPAKVGLANIPSYPMSHAFGFIVVRLLCAGLNLKIWRFYIDRFGGSNMARNFGFLMWVSEY